MAMTNDTETRANITTNQKPTGVTKPIDYASPSKKDTSLTELNNNFKTFSKDVLNFINVVEPTLLKKDISKSSPSQDNKTLENLLKKFEKSIEVTNKNSSNKKDTPKAKEKSKPSKEKKEELYSKENQLIRGYSDDVAKALQMMDLGFRDISAYTNTLSEKDKLVLDTELKLNKNVSNLSQELSNSDINIKNNAQQLLELQQQETWTNYQKKLEELHEKEFDEQTSQMREFFDKTKGVLEKNDESIRGALLGPLNLITKPFEEFFSFDIGKMVREKLFGGGKSSKKKPTENDVAKIGVAGAGYLYVANTIKNIFGNGKKGKQEDFELGSIFGGGGVPSSFVKSILSPKGIATGGLIAGLGMTVYDAVQGYFMSDEWDVGKVQATIGGAFGGNGSGITNAFKKAGQGALTGASAGFLIGGPIGALVGGLGGLVIGAVGGYLGGEEISKQLQDITDVVFTEKTWDDVKSRNLLEDIDAKVKSGELTPEVGNAYKELSQSMSAEEFQKLGQKTFESDAGNIADWIIAYGKGSLDTLTNESKIALLDNVFNLQGQDPRSRKELLHLYQWIGTTFGHDEAFITSIFKDREHTFGFLESLNELNTGKDSIDALSNSYLDSGAIIAGNNLRNQWKAEGVKAKGISKNDIIRSYSNASMYKEGYAHKVSGYLDPSQSSSIGSSSYGPQRVNDAIIRPNGKVIETNPKDTLVALKDIPNSAKSLIDNQLGLENSLGGLNKNGVISKKLDILINILQSISTKEPVQLSLPPMGRQDLDLIMSGGIV